MMSGQKYTRTNFEEDEVSGAGTPPPGEFNTSVVYKRGGGLKGRRSWLEVILLGTLGVASVTIIVLAALLVSRDKQIGRLSLQKASVKTNNKPVVIATTRKPEVKPKPLCLTPTCITVASMLINSMDTSVDPCSDFYSYACGGWIDKHVIPSGHARWSTFGELWKSNQEVMKRVIERPINSTQSDAEIKAKLYYQSCMDKNKTISVLGSKPLENLVRLFGGWAISNRTGVWDKTKWTLQKALEKMKVFGVFFSYYIGEDDKNSTYNIIQVDQGGLGLPERDYYLNKSVSEDKVLSAYLDYMTRVGVLLGGEENNTREQMLDVIEFETQLANITVPSEERRDEEQLYHKMTLGDVQKLAPFVNWIQLLNSILSIANVTVSPAEEVVVYMPRYLQNLTELLQQTLQEENGARTLQNYMMWHVVKAMTPYLTNDFTDARNILTEAISGTTGGEELWRHCITDTDQVLGFALGSLFVQEVFKGNSKQKAEDMIEEVKTAFKNNLPSLRWMDDETRKAAVDKANSVIDMIGFPEYILNKTRLNKEYKNLKINASEYFQNNIRNLYFELQKNAAMLRKPPEPYVWDMTPPTVNAYYTPTKNEIVFPAGILQAPFYSQDWPKSLNFGAMGVVMGHELTHGFDDQGREYDKFGNLRPWWNNASVERFEERTKCMVDQYASYQLNGEKVRGKQTLGENIADNGGLKAAYHAYEDWLAKHEEELPLPGVNLTHRQLFFLSFSHVWCSKSTKEADHLQILSDPHSPGKFRVIGTLSNSDDFAREYNCPRNSPMNPDKKCIVW
ncbi:endothelin-converting enzyme homolog isoform X3 [Ruditapes philippinarum]|uniref:endothelin-converting enzyme homolog isoform X3 n=1 Tax=Ruditapes philippinarum TaxID=129788 RepID=UPI00295C2B29|nr:endothelin-converting enzyme homolog isoform X3 [Ruditapes philippinarum]